MRVRTVVILTVGGATALALLLGTVKMAEGAVGAAAATPAREKAGWTWPWEDEPEVKGCANHAFDQCGGKEWTGETCCPEQHDCVEETEFYSQCKLKECQNAEHAQCGGTVFYSGETCCPSGYECKTKVPLFYSECLKSGECANEPWDQCGGKDWAGETCCPEHHSCVLQADGEYAQCTPLQGASEQDERWVELQQQGAELTLQLKESIDDHSEAASAKAAEIQGKINDWAKASYNWAQEEMERTKNDAAEARADVAEHLAELDAQIKEVEAAVNAKVDEFKQTEAGQKVTAAGAAAKEAAVGAMEEGRKLLEYTRVNVENWTKDAAQESKRWWKTTKESAHEAWKGRHAKWADFKAGVVDFWEQCSSESEACGEDGDCCGELTCYEATACIQATPGAVKAYANELVA